MFFPIPNYFIEENLILPFYNQCLHFFSYKQTKHEIVKAHHKFLWNDEDKEPNTLENQLAKQYHDQLFKEYCIGDLTHYKTSQVIFSTCNILFSKILFHCNNLF